MVEGFINFDAARQEQTPQDKLWDEFLAIEESEESGAKGIMTAKLINAIDAGEVSISTAEDFILRFEL